MGVVTEAARLAAMMLAQERLGFVMDVAAGSGNLKKGAWRRHTRDLERRARGWARRAHVEPFTRSAAPAAPHDPGLTPADFGIEVVVLKGVKTAPWPKAGEAADA